MPSKALSLKLPEELLNQVDDHAKAGSGNRSEAIRELISSGLERELLLRRIEESEKKIDKLMVVVESVFSYAFISLKLKTLDGSVSQDQFNDAKTESKEVLAALIHKQFGE